MTMLTVVRLKPTPTGRTCWLELSSGKLYKLPLDWAITHKLKTGNEISEKQFKQLRLKSISYRLSEYALRQIAISPKTSYLLRQKLKIYCQKNRLRAPNTIAKVLKKIENKGLLNDQKYVEYYLRKYPKKSHNLVKLELGHRGISRQLIEKLVHYNAAQSENAIVLLLTKKKITAALMADPREKNRILSMILRKGFSLNEAKSAIDAYLKNRYNKLP